MPFQCLHCIFCSIFFFLFYTFNAFIELPLLYFCFFFHSSINTLRFFVLSVFVLKFSSKYSCPLKASKHLRHSPLLNRKSLKRNTQPDVPANTEGRKEREINKNIPPLHTSKNKELYTRISDNSVDLSIYQMNTAFSTWLCRLKYD